MPFPEYNRVIYQKPVLEEVVCQVRFPDILKIGATEPADFQDAIRKSYPIYETHAPTLPPDIPPQIAETIMKVSGGRATGKAYHFYSSDKSWKVGLTTNSLALSTTKYTRWEEFSDALHGQIQALNELYEPSYFHRIGLRYRDVIIPSQLGIDNTPWAELLEPYIAGELATDVVNNITGSEKILVIKLDDDLGKIQAKHFLANVVDSNERCYVIDADLYYEGKVEIKNALQHLSSLNKYAGRFFRWCVTKRLYEAMDPEPVE